MKSLVPPKNVAVSQANAVQRVNSLTKTIIDNRPSAVAQRKLQQDITDKMQQVAQARPRPFQELVQLRQAKTLAPTLGSKTAVVQRLKITRKKKLLLDTDIATLEELSTLLANAKAHKLTAIERTEIKAAIDRFNPLSGASDKLGKCAPKSKKNPEPLNERKLTPGKRSEKQGQTFVRTTLVPADANALTETDSMDVIKINLFEQKKNNGRVRQVPRMVGNKEKMVSEVNCGYCLEAVPVEATDLDHVVATEHLRNHLIEISNGLSDKNYKETFEGWMKQMKLVFGDWFMTEDGGKTYSATAQAMKYLHNSQGNLLLSCKTCNQTDKNNASFQDFAKKNPWLGQKFLDANPPLPKNSYLTNDQNVSIADAINEYHETNFEPLLSEILDISESKAKHTVNAKKIALGKKKKIKSKETHKRRLDWNNEVADISSDEEDEVGFAVRLAQKRGLTLIPDEEHQTERKLRLKMEKRLAKSQKELLESQKKIKELEAQIKQEQNKKRPRSLSTDNVQQTHILKKTKATHTFDRNSSVILSSIDNHNNELKGTTLSRLNQMQVNASYHAFEKKYLELAIQDWRPKYFYNTSFDNYKKNNQVWWTGLANLLSQLHRSYTA